MRGQRFGQRSEVPQRVRRRGCGAEFDRYRSQQKKENRKQHTDKRPDDRCLRPNHKTQRKRRTEQQHRETEKNLARMNELEKQRTIHTEAIVQGLT